MAVIATTKQGSVRGESLGTVSRFLGVPFAAAPVGANRFAAPKPPESWQGVRDALSPGPTAPQIVRPFPGLDVERVVGKGWRQGDDYLNVNIWTPDPAAHGLPVMVFIHGGGFVAGSNDAPVQDGTAFARSGVVYMAINYRLGVEGWVPIDGAPTNLGLRDMIGGLQWVQANAAAFGGDPANVTVFGESAGAMAIADLMTSPLAKGLFRRAIIESGHGAMVRAIPIAQCLTKKLGSLLGIAPTLEAFRGTTNQQCLEAMEKVQNPRTKLDLRDDEGREPVFGISRFIPVYGDDVLPEKPMAALAKGAGAEIDLLIGSNAEEMNLYFVPAGIKTRLWGWMARMAMRRSEPNARAILKAYGLGRRGVLPGAAFISAMSDLVFRLPVRRFAAAHSGRTHVYEFEWRSPAFGGELGACHAMELPFVFDTLETCSGPQGLAGMAPPDDLAKRTHRIWVDFAKTGALPWPAYDAKDRQVYKLLAGAASSEPPMPAEPFVP